MYKVKQQSQRLLLVGLCQIYARASVIEWFWIDPEGEYALDLIRDSLMILCSESILMHAGTHPPWFVVPRWCGIPSRILSGLSLRESHTNADIQRCATAF